MAKIAVKSDSHPGKVATGVPPYGVLLCSGEGWSVSEVICTAGPSDRPFDEEHAGVTIGLVTAGTFQYRATTGSELMIPGSVLLGNDGDGFTCSHEHGAGDRCISIHYTPEFFGSIAEAASAVDTRFRSPRLPPMSELLRLTARATRLAEVVNAPAWEEFCIELAGQSLGLSMGMRALHEPAEASSLARVTRVVRMMENEPELPHDLVSLARLARLSPFHFLRVFEEIAGTTPHQYLLRLRLRNAAVRLLRGDGRISDVALDSGFGDISNFNRTFRREFGTTPRGFRRSGV